MPLKLNEVIFRVIILVDYSFVLYAMSRPPFLVQYEEYNLKNSTLNSFINKHAMLFMSEFFFHTHTSPVFEVTWICQFLAACLAVSAFSSFDGFFIVSILHLCAQLEKLEHDLRCLISADEKGSFKKALKFLVERHLKLLR